MSQSNKPKKTSLPIVILLVLASIAFITGLIYSIRSNQNSSASNIMNFQECKDAGGQIAESYPEQCFIGGQSFANQAQTPDGSDYIGMSEQEATVKANEDKAPNRVVERNGETLPVTMDFVPGRLNFYVKDDKVYKVDIEKAENN